MPNTKQGSRREIAVAIVRKHYEIVADVALAPSQRRLVDAFEAALKERDKRAAEICDYYSEEDGDIASQAAAAIRNGDTNAD